MTSINKGPCEDFRNDPDAFDRCNKEYAERFEGGRRHKGSKKMHKNKRHGNASLRAWVTFVKKVQKEEGIGYKEAMSVAKKRKDGGEKWRGGGDNDDEPAPSGIVPNGAGDPDSKRPDMTNIFQGGRRRRRTHKRRGSKRYSKRRGTRRHRR